MYENTHRNPQPPPSSLMTGGYSTGGGHVSIEEAARKAARALILAGEGDRYCDDTGSESGDYYRGGDDENCGDGGGGVRGNTQSPHTTASAPVATPSPVGCGVSAAVSGDGAMMSSSGSCQYYAFPTRVYALAVGADGDRFAVGSAQRHSMNNYIAIIDPDSSEASGLSVSATCRHGFPPSHVLWMPATAGPLSSVTFASTSTSLRLWRLQQPVGGPADGSVSPEDDEDDQQHQQQSGTGGGGGGPALPSSVEQIAKLQNTHKTVSAPMTSFDWSVVSPSRVAAAAVDTTITLWDVSREKMDTQMIAHDKAVLDVAFAADSDKIFGSVSDDGSLRLFDSRDLDHSTIMYESPSAPGSNTPPPPLYKLYWNKWNPHLIATFSEDSIYGLVFDTRKGFESIGLNPICEGSQDTVCAGTNAMAWCNSYALATCHADG
ncbi:WD repeat containing protein, putative [Perkinsus marinus ATCC 50983]|uniref:WD repeat containing protein, putative n=1 Tax=Perkinsus marinus (strain ATCC 50983 / TXsc) TaxID=423536 RepID=C5L7C1_PERM5|nr:WD repeat containing protein, putative [Perkinsus marinus ATCC 50983]EER07383.1 WD repeat containing protein, putative [Perkinsus marinus ATCC 50983]|eukprot:XP_002775567.1 WD repeat containing protein, putative [Perkinsus marinus ATCC 50983]